MVRNIEHRRAHAQDGHRLHDELAQYVPDGLYYFMVSVILVATITPHQTLCPVSSIG